MFQISQILAIIPLSILLFNWVGTPSTTPTPDAEPVFIMIPNCPELQAVEMLSRARATISKMQP